MIYITHFSPKGKKPSICEAHSPGLRYAYLGLCVYLPISVREVRDLTIAYESATAPRLILLGCIVFPHVADCFAAVNMGLC